MPNRNKFLAKPLARVPLRAPTATLINVAGRQVSLSHMIIAPPSVLSSR